MEHDATIAPETLKPVEPHGEVTEAELIDVRVDGPEIEVSAASVPDPKVKIDED